MKEHDSTTATIEVQPHGHAAEAHAASINLNPSPTMVVLTWVTFGIMALVLYKVAWKPILAGLDKREESIRKSIEEAEQVRRQLDEIEAKRSSIIHEADQQAKEIVNASRKAAHEAARIIEGKAKEESQILLENATREIGAAQEKAQAALRKESAELAVSLAGKLIGENLDNERNRTLTDRLIHEL